jgi:hypothetical protein
MKSKFLLALTAVFVLGLAMAVYAFNQPNASDKKSASCCSKTDSCPMKSHNTSGTHTKNVSCCDRDDCCCKTGDACPLKNKEAKTDMKNVSVVSGESCCGGAGCCKHKS